MKDSEIIAGIIYHNFIPEYKDIEISIISNNPKWLSRKILRELFLYPFQQLNCQRITARIASSNKVTIKLALASGFRHEGTLRLGCGIEDMLIFGILKKEVKWLGE